MSEIWRPIPGYEGLYEASDAGRIRGVDRIVPRNLGQETKGRLQRGTILSPDLRTKPSPRLLVRLWRNGTRCTKGVGHLVLSAFVGPCPDGLECCHNDGDATDNRLSNLRWDTHSSNVLDQVRHGTHAGAAKTECVRGHLIPADKPKRQGCRACAREGYPRTRAVA